MSAPADLFTSAPAELRRYVQAVWTPGWHALGIQPKNGAPYHHVGTYDTPDDWIAAATPYVAGEYHVWLMINGMAVRPLPGLRGGNIDITSSRALAMDLDHDSPAGAHADEGLPTEQQVGQVLAALGELAPNMVVDTGWGRQVYWLLALDATPDQRQAQLYALANRMTEIAQRLGVPLKIERLDLAGMFRVPGSSNVKIAPTRPVVISHWLQGPGFTLEYLAKRCPPVAAPPVGAGSRHVPGLITDQQRQLVEHLTDHHGAHSAVQMPDGQIRVCRPGKKYGTSANIWMGEHGDAVVTVFSPSWPKVGPDARQDNRSWVLGGDGELHHPGWTDDTMLRAGATRLAIDRVTGEIRDATQLPERFWTARPNLAAIRDAALQVGVSPEALVLAVLVAIASHIPPVIGFPGKRRGATNIFVAVLGQPGHGKGTALDRALELVPPPADYRPFKPGTAQGFVKQFYRATTKAERSADPDVPPFKRHHHPVILRVDEVSKLTAATSGDKGQALIGEIKSAVFGEGLGQTVATDEKNLQCEPHSYRTGGMIGVASGVAGPLFDDTEGGLPQRIVFANLLRAGQEPSVTLAPFDDMALDDDVGEDGGEYVRLPPLVWVQPRPEGRQSFADSSRVAARVAELVRCRWDLLDAHVPYLTHAYAVVLAYFDGRWVIQPADLTLAGDLVAMSQATRAELLAGLARSAATGEKKKSDARRAEAVATAGAVRVQQLDLERQDYARRIVATVRQWSAEHDEPPTARDLYRRVSDKGAWRLAYDEAIARGWLCEEEQETEAGGSPRRVVLLTETAP